MLFPGNAQSHLSARAHSASGKQVEASNEHKVKNYYMAVGKHNLHHTNS